MIFLNYAFYCSIQLLYGDKNIFTDSVSQIKYIFLYFGLFFKKFVKSCESIRTWESCLYVQICHVTRLQMQLCRNTSPWFDRFSTIWRIDSKFYPNKKSQNSLLDWIVRESVKIKMYFSILSGHCHETVQFFKKWSIHST